LPGSPLLRQEDAEHLLISHAALVVIVALALALVVLGVRHIVVRVGDKVAKVVTGIWGRRLGWRRSRWRSRRAFRAGGMHAVDIDNAEM
jgi:hypothetical protein